MNGLNIPWNTHHVNRDYAGKVYLRHVRINRGGYDSSGHYWGVGSPLYYWETAENTEEDCGHVRAYDRADAIAKVLITFPNAQVAK